jgi:hypothetical protein
MRKFYLLIPVIDDENALRIDDYDEVGVESDYADVFSGLVLDKSLFNNYILKASGNPNNIDYVINPLSWPICSVRFASLITSICANDIQLCDAIFSSDHNIKKDFKVLNLLRRLDCFSMSKGKYRLDVSPTGVEYVSAIYEWVLEANTIPDDVHLFRVPQMQSTVIASAELASLVLQNNLRGLTFIDEISLI